MKFQRTELIARVEDAIAAKEAYAAERTAAEALEAEAKRAKYIESTRDDWKQLADRVRLRLRNNQPITSEDLPKDLRDGRHGYIRVWHESKPRPYVADTAALKQLLVLLKAATDDEVTTSALERMGFRTAQLFTAR